MADIQIHGLARDQFHVWLSGEKRFVRDPQAARFSRTHCCCVEFSLEEIRAFTVDQRHVRGHEAQGLGHGESAAAPTQNQNTVHLRMVPAGA